MNSTRSPSGPDADEDGALVILEETSIWTPFRSAEAWGAVLSVELVGYLGSGTLEDALMQSTR
jgi:hypothetical protein